MKINKDACVKCGKCITECHNKAIKKDSEGFFIDPILCKNCTDVYDIECVRICEFKAITADDGSLIDFDPTWRLRSEHVIWLMAMIGARSNKERYPVGGHWDEFRKLISAAYLNPDLQIRLTKYFDDNCIGCAARQAPGHFEDCGYVDDMCYKQLGVELGTTMKLWDFIKIAEQKFTIPFLQTLGSIPDETLKDYIAFLHPDSEVIRS